MTSNDTLSNSIESVVERLAGSISGAYAYIFDGGTRSFIYKSESNQLMEETILKLDEEKGLASMVRDSSNNMVEIYCKDTDRKFFIKKLAADLYFGLCVEQSPDAISKAKEVMTNSFT